MFKLKLLILIVLISFFAIAGIQFSAYGENTIITPAQNISNLDDSTFEAFVKWMREKEYSENIISKWAEDYMHPGLHPLIQSELIKIAGLPYGSPLKMQSPVTFHYLDLIPTDPNIEPAPIDIDKLKECFRLCFGTEVAVLYHQYPVNYAEAFGGVTIETIAGKLAAKGDQAAIIKYEKALIKDYYKDYFQSAPSYLSVEAFSHNITRLAFSRVNSIEVELKMGGFLGYGLGIDVGNEAPNPQSAFSFHAHGHEWAHAWQQSHHYACDGPYKFIPYGTFGTLSMPQKIKTINFETAPILKIDPLQAYLLEPPGGFAHPDLILGETYSKYLSMLASWEVPYTTDPKPQILITKGVRVVAGTNAARLQVTVKNTGNIPLALLPIKIAFPSTTSIMSRTKTSIMSRTKPLVKDQEIYIEWLEPGQEKDFGFVLRGVKEKLPVEIIPDPSLKNIKVMIKDENTGNTYSREK